MNIPRHQFFRIWIIYSSFWDICHYTSAACCYVTRTCGICLQRVCRGSSVNWGISSVNWRHIMICVGGYHEYTEGVKCIGGTLLLWKTPQCNDNIPHTNHDSSSMHWWYPPPPPPNASNNPNAMHTRYKGWFCWVQKYKFDVEKERWRFRCTL